MSRISGKDTKPEVLVRKYLFSQGFRFRKNVKDLNGKPDIVLPKYKAVVFVHGCFWHGHKCKAGKLPTTRPVFWRDKIEGNKIRDRANYKLLSKSHWNVVIVWQCELKNRVLQTTRLMRLTQQLTTAH